MNLYFETQKRNNDEQDAGTKSWMVTTVVEEACRWLCRLDNTGEHMAFKISHVEMGSGGSAPCLNTDVAKDCKGNTSWLVKMWLRITSKEVPPV